ncbi:DUF1214 domain-containing protein [Chelativorans sp. Marseille-P2723]|uniref:DUF1214 domain-containing protein n=1 Tax=Chelativorans sp. Marseille-P2723 TaxID=2709133 RepID=UPI00156EBBDC|nr:DUF1214 domain-containing protein [Chelativorans sp. Marseille-P2723]
MLKTISLTLLILSLAIGGGAGSVLLLMESTTGVGTFGEGPWSATPRAGTPDADPYTRARFVREGGVPLGRAEGIAFSASRDSAGAPLNRKCTYRIEGQVPLARFWTLYAANPSGMLLPPFARRQPALHSLMAIRGPGNAYTITVSPHPSPGNWLATNGEGQMRLHLTLFDTPVSADLPIGHLTLPDITRVSCDA